jgi:hypothetical protein
MTQGKPRDSQSRKIEDARDLQSKLYREIGISAVAAALRFSTKPDSIVRSDPATGAAPARSGGLAA